MTVDFKMDIGQIVQVLVLIVAVVGAHYSLKSSLRVFGTRLDGLEKRFESMITEFSGRMGKYEDAMLKVSGELQRVIGRLEGKDVPK